MKLYKTINDHANYCIYTVYWPTAPLPSKNLYSFSYKHCRECVPVAIEMLLECVEVMSLPAHGFRGKPGPQVVVSDKDRAGHGHSTQTADLSIEQTNFV